MLKQKNFCLNQKKKKLLVKKKAFPSDIVDQWPEIFSDINLFYIPMEYVNNIVISFTNGKEMIIEIEKNSKKKSDRKNLEKYIENFFKKFNDEISDIDFDINISKIRKDAESFSKTLMTKK